MHPGKEVHAFMLAPQDATWAEVTIKTGQHDGSIVYSFDVSQVVRGLRTDSYLWESSLSLCGHSVRSKAMSVIGGKTVGVAFAQNWKSGGPSEIELQVEFFGLRLEGHDLHLNGGGGLLEFLVGIFTNFFCL